MVQNKVTIITGAARGIGFEIGKVFAENGAKVVLSDIDQEGIWEAAQSLEQSGFDCIGIQADAASEKDLQNIVKTAQDTFGRIDIIVNNAGIQHVSPIERFPTEMFEKMVKLMLTAPFILTKNVFPLMKKQRFGRIINIASINGLVGFAGKAAYNSAKHGVIGLTKVTALEGARYGITANALCPGYVDTPLVRGQLEDLSNTRGVPVDDVLAEVLFPLIPQKRLLEAKEVADYALFLASEKAKGITGQAVVIDGGYTSQ